MFPGSIKVEHWLKMSSFSLISNLKNICFKVKDGNAYCFLYIFQRFAGLMILYEIPFYNKIKVSQTKKIAGNNITFSFSCQKFPFPTIYYQYEFRNIIFVIHQLLNFEKKLGMTTKPVFWLMHHYTFPKIAFRTVYNCLQFHSSKKICTGDLSCQRQATCSMR